MKTYYYETTITPASAGFDTYDCTENVEAWVHADDLISAWRDDAEVYELGVDDLPDGIDDIRGRIRSEPTRVFAIVADRISYAGITEADVEVDVIGLGTAFPDDDGMQWYGNVRVSIGRREYVVGACVGVPESDQGSCRASGAGVRPFLSAWYTDASDHQDVPDAYVGAVIEEIYNQRRWLWSLTGK